MSSASQVMHAGEFIFDCLKPMAQAVPGTSVLDRPIPNQGKGSATKEKRTDPITRASSCMGMFRELCTELVGHSLGHSVANRSGNSEQHKGNLVVVM